MSTTKRKTKKRAASKKAAVKKRAPARKKAGSKGGRPSKYKPEMPGQAEKLCALGATDREVAEFFGVSEATLNRWKAQYPEFCESLKVGKAESDVRVEISLYRRALGYKHDAVKIMQDKGRPVIVPYVEHVPPCTTACIFWLKNRKPEEWRDSRNVEVSGHQTVEHIAVSEADRRIEALLASGKDRDTAPAVSH